MQAMDETVGVTVHEVSPHAWIVTQRGEELGLVDRLSAHTFHAYPVSGSGRLSGEWGTLADAALALRLGAGFNVSAGSAILASRV